MSRAFGQQQGGAIVLRVKDGHVLAVHNPRTVARRIATPGSTIKPFVLQLLLEKGLVRPDEALFCRNNLMIANRRLNCSHAPGLATFNAADALAASCNSYFVAAGARLKQGDLERRLHELGFARASGLVPDEGEGRITPANTVSDRQLLAIGAAGIQVTPAELASAYLRLARIDPKTADTAGQTVLLGLRRAAEYGLALQAQPAGISVAGKTGTASDSGNPFTHAWFAGFAPAEHPEVVVVVFVERGRGSNEAATIARAIFEAYARHK